MTTDTIAVATLTWVRSDAEERLLRAALKALSRHRLPVAVADTGSSPGFTTFLKTLPGFTVISGVDTGLVAQVCASMSCAARFGRPRILYTEPDKVAFFRGRFSTFVSTASNARRGAGVFLAARSDASFSTYPPIQQRAERIINDLCGDLVGPAGDYSYGPFVMPTAMLSDVEGTEAALGWGWRTRLFMAARRKGHPIVHVTADHPCPREAQLDNALERAHRLRQLSQNIMGLIE